MIRFATPFSRSEVWMGYWDLNACCAGRAGRAFVVGVSSSERYSKSSAVKFCASGSCLDMMYSTVDR